MASCLTAHGERSTWRWVPTTGAPPACRQPAAPTQVYATEAAASWLGWARFLACGGQINRQLVGTSSRCVCICRPARSRLARCSAQLEARTVRRVAWVCVRGASTHPPPLCHNKHSVHLVVCPKEAEGNCLGAERRGQLSWRHAPDAWPRAGLLRSARPKATSGTFVRLMNDERESIGSSLD